MIDDATFIRVSREAMPSLYRISLGLLRRPQDAQDAVQQGLTNAWAARDRARGGSERAWITQIVIHECRNIQRYRQRVTPVETVETGEWTPPDRTLRDAVDALPPNLRLPLLLKYMEGMSEREVAQAMRLSVPAVKSRLLRARRGLQKLLNEEVELL
jgi:RNA polymerase sigma-70 factor (ECF subfamily)